MDDGGRRSVVQVLQAPRCPGCDAQALLPGELLHLLAICSSTGDKRQDESARPSAVQGGWRMGGGVPWCRGWQRAGAGRG